MRKREPVSIDGDYYVRVVQQSPSYTPNFAKRLAAGEILPDLPYSMTDIVSEAAYEYKYTTWRGKITSTLVPERNRAIRSNSFKMGAKLACQSWIDEVVVKGRKNKLLSKIKGQTLPILMLYKDRKQTGQMVTKLFDDVIFFARNYKRPRRLLKHYGLDKTVHKNSKLLSQYKSAVEFRRTRKGIATVGDYYLQWRFGWSPLYGDIETALDAQAEAEKKGIRSSARAGLEYEIRKEYLSPAPDHPDIGGRCVSTGYFGIKASYRVTDIALASAVQIMDVPETLWDATPWSFVLDRIANVSKYLNLRNATAGTEFLSGHVSDFRKHTITGVSETRKGISVGGDPLWHTTVWRGQPRVETTFTRQIMTGFPSPTLELPYKEFVDGPLRKADYLFLAYQKLNRSLR